MFSCIAVSRLYPSCLAHSSWPTGEAHVRCATRAIPILQGSRAAGKKPTDINYGSPVHLLRTTNLNCANEYGSKNQTGASDKDSRLHTVPTGSSSSSFIRHSLSIWLSRECKNSHPLPPDFSKLTHHKIHNRLLPFRLAPISNPLSNRFRRNRCVRSISTQCQNATR